MKLTIPILIILLIATTSALILKIDFESSEVLNPDRKSYHIPDWVKHNANWWANDHISDTEFSYSIEYLIDNDIITIDKCLGECVEIEDT